MSKLMSDLKSIFEEGQNEYAVIVQIKVREFYKIICRELKEAVKDTSDGLIYTYTYELHQEVNEQTIQPFELLTEGLEEKFEDEDIDVELVVTYTSDGQRTAKFTFSGWA